LSFAVLPPSEVLVKEIMVLWEIQIVNHNAYDNWN